MTIPDPLAVIAPHYDAMMAHVCYTRWTKTVRELAALVPHPFVHLDVGCGTGVLMEMLDGAGWPIVGVDLSPAMLREGRAARGPFPFAVADMRRLPFHGSVGMITCLFDSLNFLLAPEDVRAALASFAAALRPGGIVYFDVVTEFMMTEYYAGKTWTDDADGLGVTWENDYDPATRMCTTRIRFGNGRDGQLTQERAYPLDWLAKEVEAAGLTPLGVFDAHGWGKPHGQTERADFLAVKGVPDAPAGRMDSVLERVRSAARRSD